MLTMQQVPGLIVVTVTACAPLVLLALVVRQERRARKARRRTVVMVGRLVARESADLESVRRPAVMRWLEHRTPTRECAGTWNVHGNTPGDLITCTHCPATYLANAENIQRAVDENHAGDLLVTLAQEAA